MLVEADLPDVTKARLLEALPFRAVAKDDGTLDGEKLKEAVDAAIKKEAEYLESLPGYQTGVPRGLGLSESGEPKEEDVDKALDGAFASLGLSEASRKEAVAGRRSI
jgi:hypothetical protein